jgi:hypothetical protein
MKLTSHEFGDLRLIKKQNTSHKSLINNALINKSMHKSEVKQGLESKQTGTFFDRSSVVLRSLSVSIGSKRHRSHTEQPPNLYRTEMRADPNHQLK